MSEYTDFYPSWLGGSVFGSISSSPSAIVLPPEPIINTAIYSYTGGVDTFTTAEGVTEYKIYMWGAGGGHAAGVEGGAGGFLSGVLNLGPGTYEIIVGEGGGSAATGPESSFGGGGARARYGCGGGGGRSTLLRFGNDYVTAGGGGGGGYYVQGGAGGAPNEIIGKGGDQYDGPGGLGGTVGVGGVGGIGSVATGGDGQYQRGGDLILDLGYNTGSGGGGYYGGGAGGTGSLGGGGGGGCSYTLNLTGAVEEYSLDGTAPGSTNQYYQAGVANGSTDAGVTGGPGLVVIEWLA